MNLRRRKHVMKWLLILLALYLVPLLLVGCSQRRFIYYPSRLSTTEALNIAEREGFEPWRNDAGEIIGWRMAATGAPTGSVLVMHGNAGSALNRDYFARSIHSAGPLDVFVLEYPGYGARAGSPSMQSFLAAAEEAFQKLPTNRPIYLVAESLGSGPAAHLAKTYGNRIAGIIFFAPYDDLAKVGQNHMPFLPVKLLLRDRYQPAEWLKEYRGPIKVVLAEGDTVIPARFGQRLHDSYDGAKNLETIPGVGHNDIAAQPADWWRNVFAFWRENPPKK